MKEAQTQRSSYATGAKHLNQGITSFSRVKQCRSNKYQQESIIAIFHRVKKDGIHARRSYLSYLFQLLYLPLELIVFD